jgi:hypothetical protein
MVTVPRVLPLLLALAFAFGACRKPPPKVVAMEPRPNPTVSKPADNPRERLRQNRWLAQFWEELTPAQRRRVEARLRRAQPSIARDGESAAMAWDGLGLAERDRLVFGGSAPGRRATAAATITEPGGTVGAESEGSPPTP